MAPTDGTASGNTTVREATQKGTHHMSPYYAVLLSLLLSVEAFQPASQCLRAGHVRSASASMLALRPINAGDELIAHDTFDQEHAVGLIQQDFSDAQQPKKCGQCSECTCGRNTAKGSRTGVPKMSAPEVPEWEMEQVIASGTYLNAIAAGEREALRQLETFLKRNPPSAPPSDVPDDILG